MQGELTAAGQRAGIPKRINSHAIRARVINFNRLDSGVIYLLVIDAKAVRGTIPAHLLKAIQESFQQGNR
ncbi:hypothetical protein [uncultured Lamprocystis sp.]|uniref:hypothetical protein n=1 Tax=uncultured Lamprocystis sp. TaxID=543132 RepID=UPI0025D77256|nr:hypothetical protein [uncultured Lamprocystis sp.]